MHATEAERVPKICDNVSAENPGRGWSARFHSWLLQGLELTAALDALRRSHGVHLGCLEEGRLKRGGVAI